MKAHVALKFSFNGHLTKKKKKNFFLNWHQLKEWANTRPGVTSAKQSLLDITQQICGWCSYGYVGTNSHKTGTIGVFLWTGKELVRPHPSLRYQEQLLEDGGKGGAFLSGVLSGEFQASLTNPLLVPTQQPHLFSVGLTRKTQKQERKLRTSNNFFLIFCQLYTHRYLH